MALESGRYHIFSKVVDADAPVGRNHVEDNAFLPMAVYKLPTGAEPPEWDVEKLPNGKYKLQNRGATVGAVDGHLFAFLKAETLVAVFEWTILRNERDAEGNSYVISRYDGHGWVVTEPESQDISQIAVKPIIVGVAIPPFYPPTEVFVFKKVDSE